MRDLTPLSAALWLLSTAPSALSEDVEAAAAAAEAALDGLPSWFPNLLLLIPLIAYGGFYYLRAAVNPRAGFLDFLFVFGIVVVFANIFTSIVFKVRLY